MTGPGWSEVIYLGGLMRCDLETLRDRTTRAVEGEIQQCKYSDDPAHRAIFTDGAWRWLQPPSTAAVPGPHRSSAAGSAPPG